MVCQSCKSHIFDEDEHGHYHCLVCGKVICSNCHLAWGALCRDCRETRPPRQGGFPKVEITEM